MMKRPRIAAVAALTIALLFSCFAGASDAAAQTSGLQLGAPFCDHAVLQRDMPVPVWGWSTPGAEIMVTFGGQSKTATAGKDGKWMVRLDPLKASFEPRTMSIASSTGPQLAIKDLLVGEVWLASGQSNMEWKAGKCNVAKLSIPAKDGVAPIREFEVTNCYAQLQPIEKAVGAWKNGDYGEYSAIALAFADTLYQQLGVPIGILNCSFSSTQIQAWTPREGFRDGKDEYTQAIYKKVLASDPTTPEHKAAWSRFYTEIGNALEQNAERVKKGETAEAVPTQPPGNFHGNRDATWMFNARLNPVVPYALRGGIWNQGYANMGEGLVYYNNLHSLVRGWRIRWDRPELPVYFHQFYTPGNGNPEPSIGGSTDMRLGTWLARDIPQANMASQIDIGGGIHYRQKAVSGQRLGLLALKNQYPSTTIKAPHDAPALNSGVGGKAADLVAEGPMFKSYTVEGNKLIVTFDHADGGLVVAETKSNATGKEGTGFADPKVIPNGEQQVKLFYLADENRVWYPADIRIEGQKVVVTSPKVKAPRGVSYATSGVSWQPNLYNGGLLPATPFIVYNQETVTAKTWPDEKLKIAGVEPDAGSMGLLYEWRKMPILSTQFRDNAVLQAGQPITFWGSVLHDFGHEAKGEAVVHFSFTPRPGSGQAGIEKTIPVKPGPNIVDVGPNETRSGSGKEWRVTVPPMEASAEPKTLKVSFTIDGELAREEVVTNIVVGDVWFVAAPQMALPVPAAKPPAGVVRVMERKAKRSSHPSPSRYSIAVSRTPGNRFAAEWRDAGNDFAGYLGQQIYARTGKPVGIIFMANTAPKGGSNPELKSWIPLEGLKEAPSLVADYKDLAAVVPGTPYYAENVQRYVADWHQFWGMFIPQMIATRAVPQGTPWSGVWGSYPRLGASVSSKASQTYNVLVHSFTPAGLKGIIFLSSPAMFAKDQGALYGEQLSTLADSWKKRFACKDPYFFYTIPSKALAPKITRPGKIEGQGAGFEITQWPEGKQPGSPLGGLVEKAVRDVYGQP